ncbi:MAG TPA: hypothetical protein VFZ17_03500, partial [Acidimicrobiia bacterium]|nr:hypothetical protein [Acidimicrobiia bacterium]
VTSNGTSSLDALAPDHALDDSSTPGGESTGAFWPAPAPPKRKGLLRRIPVSAVLEVIAVLLILVFILLRLS